MIAGQLPMALTQTRNADGSWSGYVGITCSICHSGQVGTAADGPGPGPLHGNNGLADVNNTRMHSQSNTGHEFTDVLTDAERAALIEYLKTTL
jgi:hypothetical protein